MLDIKTIKTTCKLRRITINDRQAVPQAICQGYNLVRYGKHLHDCINLIRWEVSGADPGGGGPP